jgi:hypothetical protein
VCTAYPKRTPTPQHLSSHNSQHTSRIVAIPSALEAREFTAPDSGVASRLSSVQTLIPHIYGFLRIKVKMFSVSPGIKVETGFIPSPIVDRPSKTSKVASVGSLKQTQLNERETSAIFVEKPVQKLFNTKDII